MDLSVNLAPRKQKGLILANPVMTASGTFGYGTEYEHLFNIQTLGAVVCKGTTLKPREGNPQPRIAETPSGILNAIGLQNIGVDALIQEKSPVWSKWKTPVIVNIAGNSAEEYAEMARRLEGVPGISGIEVNISCPNVKAGGQEFGADVPSIAKAVVEAGADAIVLINTLKGMAIDIKTRRPVLGNITGGLSGPAVKPVALRMVYEVAGKLPGVPLIGSGGVMTAADAIEFFLAGASAVQIGTANLINARAPAEVLSGIRDYLEKNGFKDVKELVGLARR
jgi:dihydroorotate dehydrogenase (NAD+) catalytic subunit